ncbi:hypothetical protein AB0F71_31035 [Kitasatospora sp. NPDC028055]|uniref:hypothetical protein n=1 Tax=Kitasatospora sp. NPDC028055 TaxID=3155653 RepID=UPI00340FEB1A
MKWQRGKDFKPKTWTTLDNEVIDDDLSCRALGLLTRWLRRPEGAEIDSVPDMVKRAKWAGKQRLEGRDALYAASYELEEAGYLVRELEANELGQHEWVVNVYSTPVPPEMRSNPADRKRDPEGRKQAPKGPKRLPKAGPKAKPQVAPITDFQESGSQDTARPDSAHPDSADQGSSSKDSPNDSSSSTDPRTPATSRATSAKKKKEINNQDEPSPPKAAPSAAAVPAPREEPASGAPAAEVSPEVQRIVAAWMAGRDSIGVGRHRGANALAEFTDSAVKLVAKGESVEWLVSVAFWMGSDKPSWWRLGEATTAQRYGAPARPTAPRRPDPGKCPRHPAQPLDCPTCFRESEQRRGSKQEGLSIAEILAAEGVPWPSKTDA